MAFNARPIAEIDVLPIEELLHRARQSFLRQTDLAAGTGFTAGYINNMVQKKTAASVSTRLLLERFIVAHERALVDHLATIPHCAKRMREILSDAEG